MEDTYKIPVTCSNCDYSGLITLPKGTAFNENFTGIRSITHTNSCPHCGCNTLIKSSAPKWSKPDNIWMHEGNDRMLCVAKNDTQLTLNRG